MEREAGSAGIERARKRAMKQRKYVRPLYSLLSRDIRALNVSGDYLEMSAGSGILAAMLAGDANVTSITAVDIAADDVAVANEILRAGGLGDRVRCLVGDVHDQAMIRGLGKFDVVYSTLSLHHWMDPARAVGNLWEAVAEDGVLYVCDFRRVWWGRLLRFRDKGIDSAGSLGPGEIEAIFRGLGVVDFTVRTGFPPFLQSVTAWKGERIALKRRSSGWRQCIRRPPAAREHHEGQAGRSAVTIF